MAASVRDDDELISGINVTPLVDVVLVLLVVLMVTAGYLVARTIPVDLPRGATGVVSHTTLAITIDREGSVFVDATRVERAELERRIQLAHANDPETRAVIAADGSVRHRQVVSIVDLLRQQGIVRFAINVQPDDVAPTHR